MLGDTIDRARKRLEADMPEHKPVMLQGTCFVRCSMCKQVGWLVGVLNKPVNDTDSSLFVCDNRQSDHHGHYISAGHRICANLVKH